MPRLIILLLTLASLTILTVQNLGADKAVSLVVLGTPLSSIPLGLLLLAAFGTGALTALILYGLLGLRRPAESSTKSPNKNKYKPMGSRVPYPESDSSTIPPTGSAYSTTTTSPAYGSSNSAFVTEPPVTPVDRAGTAPGSATTAPQNSPGESPNPSAPSKVYSPFSRDSDATGKKKSPTAE